VRPHPHINLATVTYLFEGEIVDRDSLGSEQSIRPGAVNWKVPGDEAELTPLPDDAQRHSSQPQDSRIWTRLLQASAPL
jgi:hypothetical protein